MKKALAISLLTTALSVPALSMAHDFWLLPSSTVLSGQDSWVTVDGAAGNDKFHFNHRPLRLTNLVITAPDGKTVEPKKYPPRQMTCAFCNAPAAPKRL